MRKVPPERIKYLSETGMDDGKYLEEMYMSSLDFWSDIVELARSVDHSLDKETKRKFIIEKLTRINKNLPSFVFIPSMSKVVISNG